MKEGYETYDCAVTEGECMIVEGDDEGRPEITIEDVNHQIIMKTEDIPRLIAQLTAALPSKPLGESGQLPDERSCLAALEKIASLGPANDFQDCLEIAENALVSNASQLPEDTMEVRIAVATSRSGKYDEKFVVKSPSFHAYGHSDDTDEQASHEMTADADEKEALVPSPRLLSWVTARVPLPPKPVVHEVEGEVEVQK